MSELCALELKKVSKTFRLSKKSIFSDQDYNKVAALQNISLKVKHGECVGIIGRNGSGKTTLLRTIAGVISQDKGKVKVNGNLMSFIDLNAGINQELTGKENIFLYGSLLGMSNKEIKGKYNSIVDYAQIPKKFINTKFKNYSSGMKVRLIFSVAMANNPDILLIDEAISVGDEAFQKKSFNKIRELKRNGKTILIVSHSLSQLSNICDSIILLEEGRIIKSGEPKNVINYYLEYIYDKDAYLLINSINHDKRELTKLIETIEKKGFMNNFFFLGKKSILKRKKDELKRDIIDKICQVVDTYVEKNKCLLNLQLECEDKKDIDEKMTNLLLSRRIDNNFKILEFLFLEIRYLKNEDIGNQILSLFERAFIDLFELVSSAEDVENIIIHFIKFYKLLESLKLSKTKNELISEFSYFIYRKSGFIGDESLRKKIDIALERILKKTEFKQNLSIQKYEGYTRRRFDVTDNEDERKKLIYEFFDACINNLKEIKNDEEKYLFFKNTILGMLHSFVSKIKDVSFKISVAEDLQKIFNKQIRNYYAKEKEQKVLDILGSFLRNELVDLDDIYLQLNLEMEKIKRKTKKNISLKNLEKEVKKIKTLKNRIHADLIDMYERDADFKKIKWGFGDITIENVEFYNANNENTNVFNTNERFLVRIFYSAKKKLKKPMFGIAIHKGNGIHICGDNFIYNKKNGFLAGKGYIDYVIESLPLARGNFLLSVSIYDTMLNIPQDHHYKSYPFKVVDKVEAQQESGLLNIKGNWKIK